MVSSNIEQNNGASTIFLDGSKDDNNTNHVENLREPIDSREKLMSSVDKSINLIESILNSSGQVRTEFKVNWSTILESYNEDVSILDKELEKFPPSWEMLMQMKENEYYEKKGGKAGNGGNTANHALNFHLQQLKKNNNENHEIFILPPEGEDELDVVTNEVDDSETASTITFISKQKGENKANKSRKRDSERREQAKFDNRVKILNKLEIMRESELQLEKRLFGTATEMYCGSEKEETIGCNDLTDRERDELTTALERCRERNCKDTVKLISDYKPRIRSSNMNNRRVETRHHEYQAQERIKRLGIEFPSVKKFLQDIQKEVESEDLKKDKDEDYESDGSLQNEEVSDVETIKKDTKKEKSNLKGNNNENLIMSRKNNGGGSIVPRPITRQKVDKKVSESLVLQDPDHFLDIQDLPVDKPITAVSSLRDLIVSNTQSVNTTASPSPSNRKFCKRYLYDQKFACEEDGNQSESNLAESNDVLSREEVDSGDENKEYESDDFDEDENRGEYSEQR